MPTACTDGCVEIKSAPFSGVTNSGCVWRKVPESEAWSATGALPHMLRIVSPDLILHCRNTFNYYYLINKQLAFSVLQYTVDLVSLYRKTWFKVAPTIGFFYTVAMFSAVDTATFVCHVTPPAPLPMQNLRTRESRDDFSKDPVSYVFDLLFLHRFPILSSLFHSHCAR